MEPELLIAIIALLVAGGVGFVVARRPGPDEDVEDIGDDRERLSEPEDDLGHVDLLTRDGQAPAEAPPEEPGQADVVEPDVVEPDEVEEVEDLSLAERFKRRLSKTRNVLGTSVRELFGGGVSEDAWEGLEEALILADVGVTATTEIVEELRRKVREEGVTDGARVLELLKAELRSMLGDSDRRLARADDDGPTVWLVTGVNGAGKTTTIGKLAMVEKRSGVDAVLAAGDTFRAAASEQLELWAQRTEQPVVTGEEGADPASVAYRGHEAALEQDAPLLIVDTAGRLHNKSQLMDELGKVKRVLEKQAGPLEETLLVLDATTGQNGIQQARSFMDAVDVTGIVLTKLDGSSRGGIVVAVQRELGLPVKLVGLGEDVDDLALFDPDLFVEGLFADVGV